MIYIYLLRQAVSWSTYKYRRTRKLIQVDASLQNQNLRTDLRWAAKRNQSRLASSRKSRKYHAYTVDLSTCVDLPTNLSSTKVNTSQRKSNASGWPNELHLSSTCESIWPAANARNVIRFYPFNIYNLRRCAWPAGLRWPSNTSGYDDIWLCMPRNIWLNKTSLQLRDILMRIFFTKQISFDTSKSTTTTTTTTGKPTLIKESPFSKLSWK